MRFFMKPVLFPLLVMACFCFALFCRATRQHDRRFAWAVSVGSAVAAVIGNALYVYTTDKQIRDISEKPEYL